MDPKKKSGKQAPIKQAPPPPPPPTTSFGQVETSAGVDDLAGTMATHTTPTDRRVEEPSDFEKDAHDDE